MYIPDLAELSTDDRYSVRAIAFLDRRRPFAARALPSEAQVRHVNELVAFTLANNLAVQRTRGIHHCNICRDESAGSSACILVPTDDPKSFFLTNFLLPHYVQQHRYQPPGNFVLALERDFASWPKFPNDIRMCVTSPEGEAINANGYAGSIVNTQGCTKPRMVSLRSAENPDPASRFC